ATSCSEAPTNQRAKVELGDDDLEVYEKTNQMAQHLQASDAEARPADDPGNAMLELEEESGVASDEEV
ncbi:unnamed protein product, partial [Symbiodinium necroappetens]